MAISVLLTTTNWWYVDRNRNVTLSWRDATHHRSGGDVFSKRNFNADSWTAGRIVFLSPYKHTRIVASCNSRGNDTATVGKLSLCLGVWLSGCIEPLAAGEVRFTPRPLHPHWIGGWVIIQSRSGGRGEEKILDATGTRTPNPRSSSH
jgi:hypothetical protein